MAGTVATPVVAAAERGDRVERATKHLHNARARLPPHQRGNNANPADSESEWSEEEEMATLQRSYTTPGPPATSTARLNRAMKAKQGGRLKLDHQHFISLSRVRRDGRVNISVNETAHSGYLAHALGTALERQTQPNAKQEERDAQRAHNLLLQEKGDLKVPRLTIVIMVIGSRGDIQPFVKIGKLLQDNYGHRVRIATHPKFRKFVEEDIGLEFFSIGGDPSELMGYMVKNPGLMPSIETIKAGEVSRRRDEMFQMMNGFWRSCVNLTDDEQDIASLKSLGGKTPFVADAIIANPPSFAHYHCAEKLGCPLHLVFTFPYTPTQAFPHPLANIKTSNMDPHFTNYMSYPLVDLMTWQGLGDLVNRFRTHTLGLEPVSTLWAPGQFTRMRVPTTYLWSPSLVPKPADWGPEVDIAGYVFLDLASHYTPPDDMVQFLRRDGPDKRPIVYIGFGSISGIDDPNAFAQMIFDAVGKADVRAIISRGWGGMGDGMEKPDGVYMVDNVPHDWLFPKIDAVVHHGGAGTTATGLKFGKPTMIVPFFGDQPFWSAMVAKAGAGVKEALPLKKLDVDKFAKGIRECLEPEAKAKAQEIAAAIAKDGDGAQNAVDSFHRSLPLQGQKSMRCGIFPDRVAVWHVKHANIRLSVLAAYLLVENKQLQWSDLSLLVHRKWNDFQGPGEPITGAGGALITSLQEAVHALQSIPENSKKNGKRSGTVQKALAGPGNVALALRGTSAEEQTEEFDRLNNAINLTGDAEPLKTPFWKSHRRWRSRSNQDEPGFHSTTSKVEHRPVVVSKAVGKGLGQTARAIVCMPADVLYAITLGFRNAPRLYGDRTVRPLPRPITGFRLGVRTASAELYHGFYDGLTGLVRLPIHDVREGGYVELPKGIARGIGALVLKPLAGTLGIVAYTSHGALQSLRSRIRDTSKTKRWIRRARIRQGLKEIELLRREEQDNTKLRLSLRYDNCLDKMRSLALTKWNSKQRGLLQPDQPNGWDPIPHTTAPATVTHSTFAIPDTMPPLHTTSSGPQTTPDAHKSRHRLVRAATY
ncbi:hypothetical protein DV738_g5273, partial [Chaetothyriales sp. CBS 135597]